MPKTRPKTVLPEPRPEFNRRRRLFTACGARRRRDPSAIDRAMSSRADGAIALERRLGRSGIVEVWSATLSGRGSCAVKFPTLAWSGHGGAARLIERESAFLRQAAHANVVEAIDVVTMPSGPGLVMEFLPGGDLVPLAGSHPKHWAGYVRNVVSALAHVHRCGLVHSDVKPRNVLLDDGGGAKLIDFGAAADLGSVRRTGSGTPAYQSEAQRVGAPADIADDIHALAVMTYELLCGRLPYGPEPDTRALEMPPVPALEIRPAYSDELKIVDLAALIGVLLSSAAQAQDRPLDALDARLAAIITEHE